MVRVLSDDEARRLREQQERWVRMLQSRYEQRQQQRSQRLPSSDAAQTAEQRRRDKQQQIFRLQSADQQAALGAMAADRAARIQADRDKQQQKNLLKRDKVLANLTAEEREQQARIQRARDAQQFGYSQQETDQQFQNQIQRDALQQGYTLDRDQLQQQNTLQRDMLQGGIQADRDKRLNMFDVNQQMLQHGQQLERDSLQNEFQSERDARLNIFDTQRDVRRQQFEMQSRFQEEIANVSAQWLEQVNAAKSAGLDFSPQQQKEMQDLDRAFRKKILNGDFPEDVKQRAMLEHQKKLAAFIPEQKVVTDQQQFTQSIVKDEETGARYMVIRDPRGGVKYEPIQQQGMPDAGDLRYQEQSAQRQQETVRKAMLQREDEYQAVLDKLASETDAEMNPRYSSPEQIQQEAMKQFARKEEVYRQHYGLPPLAPYQAEADKVRAEQEAAAKRQQQQQQQAPKNPYRAILNQSPQQTSEDFSVLPKTGQFSPVSELHSPTETQQQTQRQTQQPPKAVEMSSTTIGDQIREAEKSGDTEAVAAMQIIQTVTKKHNGAPPEDSEDMAAMVRALMYLRTKGLQIQAKPKPKPKPSIPENDPTPFHYPLG